MSKPKISPSWIGEEGDRRLEYNQPYGPSGYVTAAHVHAVQGGYRWHVYRCEFPGCSFATGVTDTWQVAESAAEAVLTAEGYPIVEDSDFGRWLAEDKDRSFRSRWIDVPEGQRCRVELFDDGVLVAVAVDIDLETAGSSAAYRYRTDFT